MTAHHDRALWDRAFDGITFLNERSIELMQAHWAFLVSWSKYQNLTAILRAEDAIWLHYRDSLAVSEWLTGDRVIDIGSGAGFPGIVLAISNPTLRVMLLEPRRQRFAFLCAAVAHLGLPNVGVKQARVENMPDERFDHGVTRATFSQDSFLPSARAWLQPEGTLLCLRGPKAPVWGTRHTYTLNGPRAERHTRCIDVLPARPEATG